MAPLQPLLLELPLLLTCWGFSAALMGLSGSHIHQFMSIRDKIANQSPSLPGFVELDTAGIERVDLAMLIVGCISFAFIGVFLFLSCGQFKGKRGEYSGKGTGAWLFVGLVLLTLSGAWTGAVSAMTAWAVKYSFTFTRGPNYSEPFSTEQRLYLRQIDVFVREQFSTSLNLAGAPRIDNTFLGVWGTFSTLEEANAYLNSSNYLQWVKSYKAQVAVGWVTVGTVFFTMVVHFALPFAWQRFGLTRQPKKNSYNEV